MQEETRTVCHSTSPRIPYHPRESKDKNQIMHCGQLKLLCLEAEFLNKWAEPGDLVVYVSGSGCMHLPTISRMFPKIHFDVYDTIPLNPLILGETAPRFSFIQRKFETK